MSGIDTWLAVADELEACGFTVAAIWVRVRVQAKEVEPGLRAETPTDERRILANELQAVGWGYAARWIRKRADEIDAAESLWTVAMERDTRVHPLDVHILCSVSDKAAFKEALATFMASHEVPGGYAISVRELDVPIIPLVRIKPEVQP